MRHVIHPLTATLLIAAGVATACSTRGDAPAAPTVAPATTPLATTATTLGDSNDPASGTATTSANASSTTMATDATTAADNSGTVTFGFDDEPTGQGPVSFAPLLGDWVVEADATAPSPPNVYAQVGTQNITPPAGAAGQIFGKDYADYLDKIDAYQVFPTTVADTDEWTDFDASVAFKAVSGKVDQTGGLIFRVVDPTNYYIWRCNVLEQDCRLWKYQDGQRSSVESVSVGLDVGAWYQLRVRMVGAHMELYIGDRLLLEHDDADFARGRVGLWTKADAVTYFDDFSVSPAT